MKVIREKVDDLLIIFVLQTMNDEQIVEQMEQLSPLVRGDNNNTYVTVYVPEVVEKFSMLIHLACKH